MSCNPGQAPRSTRKRRPAAPTAIATKTGNGELPRTVEFLLGIIPTSVIGAFADNVLIQVLFFAVLFGLALAILGEKGGPVILTVIDQASHAFFTIIGRVMKLAPLDAFGAMAYIIGQYGIESPASYGNDLSICLLFLAQALEFDLSHGEQITALMVLMLTSKGMAGVPGSSFLALSATVAAIGHGAIPVAAVALLLGADRIMDSMRVSVNLLGNCVATFVVANWEGQLDKDRMRRVLNGEDVGVLELDPADPTHEIAPEAEALIHGPRD
jgi:Na+/H+-dicarboxylate symporter